MEKVKFYVAETTSARALRKAKSLKARTLAAAKREASRGAAFYGTVLTLGCAIDDDGVLLNPVARRLPSSGWEAL